MVKIILTDLKYIIHFSVFECFFTAFYQRLKSKQEKNRIIHKLLKQCLFYMAYFIVKMFYFGTITRTEILQAEDGWLIFSESLERKLLPDAPSP